MQLAVLGVGLIGGSIGLAARKRLDAEVTGYDPDPATLNQAIETGALDRGAETVADAVAGADAVFCAAPVGALPALAAEALAATGEGTVVTDVGSTKRELLASMTSPEGATRFIGGHPLAGAETAGVEHARENLFDGALWYLVPTERSEGELFTRLQRIVGGLGARPEAIDPDAHDRAMATVSHLPHVLANVLVSRAAALSGELDRLPAVGRSFRDTTRIAGANPLIWGDILTANRDIVAEEIDAVIERLSEAATLLRAGDAAEVAAWQAAALSDRHGLADRDLGGGPMIELRLGVENRPGVVAEIALALGRAGVNIEDMGLEPAADRRSGAISIWVTGSDQAELASRVVGELGHTVSIVPGGE